MRVEARVLSIDLKLCPVVAASVADFKSTRRRGMLNKILRHPLPDRAENSGQRYESLNLVDVG
jgi:hypothetical protein